MVNAVACRRATSAGSSFDPPFCESQLITVNCITHGILPHTLSCSSALNESTAEAATPTPGILGSCRALVHQRRTIRPRRSYHRLLCSTTRPIGWRMCVAPFGTWDVGSFVAAHNAIAACFNFLFDSTSSEAVDARAQDWSTGMSYILPNFHMIDRILDKIERDNAEVVIIVPEWPHKAWWRRVHSGAWRARLLKAEMIPVRTLTPYNDQCFFGTDFTMALLVMRTPKL